MAYSFQTFSVGQVLTAAQMNQVEVNIRDKTSYTTAITLSAAAINETRSNIAQHATTMNFWAAGIGNVLDGTGSAVTLTACANSPQGGASRKFYPLAGTIIEHGGPFDVDGNLNQTAADGDCWEFVPKTISTFKVHITKEDCTAVVVAAPPVFARVVLTGGDITTTSTTFVDATGVTVTITTGAFPVAYGLVATGFRITANEYLYLDVDIDGVRQGNTANGLMMYQMVNGGIPRNLSFTGQSLALTAGPHTIKLQWRGNTANSGTLYASSPALMFWAHEVR